MQAILMSTRCGPKALQLGEMPMPDGPGPSCLRACLHATSVNPVNTNIRHNGTYYPGALLAVFGCDGAGVVNAVGGKVTRLRPGAVVSFFHGGIGGEQGNYAQYITIYRRDGERVDVSFDATGGATFLPLVCGDACLPPGSHDPADYMRAGCVQDFQVA